MNARLHFIFTVLIGQDWILNFGRGGGNGGPVIALQPKNLTICI